jgi:hypothetical protein
MNQNIAFRNAKIPFLSLFARLQRREDDRVDLCKRLEDDSSSKCATASALPVVAPLREGSSSNSASRST